MSGPPWADDVPQGRRQPRGRPAAPGETVLVAVQSGRVQVILWLVVGSLVCLNFLVSVIGRLNLLPWTLTRFFDGNDHDSFLIGTTATIGLLTALLMFGCMVAARHRGDLAERGWRMLGWVTLFVFADETTSLHRSVADVVRARYHFTGAAGYTWALMYLPAAVAVIAVLLRDARHFPPAVLRRLLPGGALYAFGVIGLEPVLAGIARDNGDDSLSFRLLAAFADSCAIVGLVLVFSAALVAAGWLADGFTFSLPYGDRATAQRSGIDRSGGGS